MENNNKMLFNRYMVTPSSYPVFSKAGITVRDENKEANIQNDIYSSSI